MIAMSLERCLDNENNNAKLSSLEVLLLVFESAKNEA